MTLAELLEIDHKQNSLTLEELQAALTEALTLPAVRSNASVSASITAALTAVTLYMTVKTLYEQVVALMPAIKTATKAAAVPLNPAMAAEVAQDLLVVAMKTALGTAVDSVKNLKTAVLNTEIPGT